MLDTATNVVGGRVLGNGPVILQGAQLFFWRVVFRMQYIFPVCCCRLLLGPAHRCVAYRGDGSLPPHPAPQPWQGMWMGGLLGRSRRGRLHFCPKGIFDRFWEANLFGPVPRAKPNIGHPDRHCLGGGVPPLPPAGPQGGGVHRGGGPTLLHFYQRVVSRLSVGQPEWGGLRCYR